MNSVDKQTQTEERCSIISVLRLIWKRVYELAVITPLMTFIDRTRTVPYIYKKPNALLSNKNPLFITEEY